MSATAASNETHERCLLNQINEPWFLPAYAFLNAPINYQHDSWYESEISECMWENIRRDPTSARIVNAYILNQLHRVTFSDLTLFNNRFFRLLLADRDSWYAITLRLGLSANFSRLRGVICGATQRRITASIGEQTYHDVLKSDLLITEPCRFITAYGSCSPFEVDKISDRLMGDGCNLIALALTGVADGILQRFVRKFEHNYGYRILQQCKGAHGQRESVACPGVNDVDQIRNYITTLTANLLSRYQKENTCILSGLAADASNLN